ncbi:enoyl-CoA hydratase [Rhodococcoides trifolii]|uniref:Enoyl-CoA hydratase n=1 Tax=Rhodococcoides trifolii TaxID=908250 RepID=A0A917FTD0_9NOCA|nr:enoyl-CoA hydratase/isomerase family protein [Rhodococcus trifolii]GGG03329.1 enoyl-CoA hydratase [Rhodococcus trifolii]
MTTETEQLTQTGRTSELTDLMTTEPPPDAVIDRIGVQRCGPVVIVTLSHPSALNSLALESWRRLRTTFEQLAHEGDLRAVIVRGSGTRAFAAGADIKQFPETRMTSRDAMHYNEFVSGTLRAVAALPVPVIAAVRGLAVGGGCELATACDVRLVADDARIGIPVGKLGVILGYTESRAASAVIGSAALKYLLFSGELMSAADAERVGFAQKVVAPNDLAGETVSLVTSICRQSAVTIRAAKVIADMHGRALTAEDTELVHRLTVEAYEGDDLKEGVAAFTQGRQAVFGGREGV